MRLRILMKSGRSIYTMCDDVLCLEGVGTLRIDFRGGADDLIYLNANEVAAIIDEPLDDPEGWE